jgi:hypothetical protein
MRELLSVKISDTLTHKVEKSFAIAHRLLIDVEGKTVLTQPSILIHFTEILQDLQQPQLSNKTWLAPALHLLANTNLPELQTILLRYVSHPTPAITKNALLALAKTHLPKEGLSEWRYYDQDDSTKTEALAYLLKNNYLPDLLDARQLLTKTATADQLIASFRQRGYPYLISLIGSPSDTNLTLSQQLTLFELCGQQDFITEQLPPAWLEQLRIEMDIDKRYLHILACWMKTVPASNGLTTSRIQPPVISWLQSLVESDNVEQRQLGLQALARHSDPQANRLLLQIIKDEGQCPKLRFSALQVAVERGKPYALPLALYFATQANSSLFEQAITLIETHGDSPTYRDFLRQRASDKQLSFEQRWNAIKLLSLQQDYTILDFL